MLCPALPCPAVVLVLSCAQPLDKLQRTELTKEAQQYVQAGFKLVMQEKVDRSLMGGFVLEFEDRLVDMSVKKKLEEFNNLVREGAQPKGAQGGCGVWGRGHALQAVAVGGVGEQQGGWVRQMREEGAGS